MMRRRRVVSVRVLQVLVAVLALVPVSAGLAGVLDGIDLTGGRAVGLDGIATDSQFRYLSGLLLAIGLGFWSTVPRLPLQTRRFRLLTGLVVVGGIGRLFGLLQVGIPSAPMLGGLAMELVVTPLLCLLQAMVSTRR